MFPARFPSALKLFWFVVVVYLSFVYAKPPNSEEALPEGPVTLEVDNPTTECNDCDTTELSIDKVRQEIVGVGSSKTSELSAFDSNRLSILEWLASVVGNGWGGGSGNPSPPEAVDPATCMPCTCGLTNKKTRIVGGEETQVNQYPWMALLTYNGDFYCGGSLISARYVLTAAHCVNGFRASKIGVRLLEHDRSTDNETVVIERSVKYVVKHSAYNPSTLDNDIAIIRLAEDVEIMNDLRPVCLPPLKKSFTGVTGIVTGWGVRDMSKLRKGESPTLLELEVPVMSNDDCRTTGYSSHQITDNMMCAGYKEGGKDSCQGDSGGPLHYSNSTFHMVIGVVSWGQGCARPNYPGVYTRVNRYIPWIEKHTADSCYCYPINYKVQ